MVMPAQRPKGRLSCNFSPCTWYTGVPGGWTDANVAPMIRANINNYKRNGVKPNFNQPELAVAWMKKTSTNPKEESGVHKTVFTGWFDVIAFTEPAQVAHVQRKYMVVSRCATCW